MAANHQFHISSFPPNDNWPRGGWSLYQITGDQIAQRTRVEDGKIAARYSWCGFVGCFETLQEVMAAINAESLAKAGA